jgi:hypothetical protein
MEQGGDFSYNFTVDGLNKDFYESLRMWPQTQICYIETAEGWVVAKVVEHMPFLPEKYCHQEFPTSHLVKWEYKS